jgi:peptidoglycan/LPS O-acetylase OafA/YrhL
MKYRGLDSFRLFAFVVVFLFHVQVLPVGYVGVLAFFVLSGFLITPILVDMRRELSGARFFVNFYGRRSLRIFPLYYFYLALMVGAAIVALFISELPRAMHQLGGQLGYATTYTYDFFHASRAFTHSPLLTHFWSLAVEEQFYLLWPLVVFCSSFKQLRRVLLVLIVAGPFIRLVEAGLISTSFGRILGQRSDLTVYVLPFSHIDAFAIGGYLALFSRTPSTRVVGAYSAVLLVVGMLSERIATGSSPTLGFGYGPFMADSWKFVWAYSALNLLFGWILLMIRDGVFFRPVVEHSALTYLGRISYGLYVYHFAVIWGMSQAVALAFPESPHLGRLVLIVGAFAITVAVSMVSFVVIEAPMLRLKDRYFPRTSKPVAVVEPSLVPAGPA